MKVQLMLTCLCDAFFGEVGIASVKVLEAAGCKVVFPEAQTCCGQPPFNAGDWKASRRIAEHCLAVFDPALPIVTPSGSCAAMAREGYPMLWPEREHVECYEIGEFLVKVLGISDWGVVVATNNLRDPGEPPPFPPPTPSSQKEAPDSASELRTPDSGLRNPIHPPTSTLKVAFHRACHGRGLGLTDEQERLVASLANVELVTVAQADQCCGFGGAFSATHGKLSSGIGLEKLKNVVESGAEWLVSGDMGCLMHLNGLIQHENLPIKTKHYVQLLSEALPG